MNSEYIPISCAFHDYLEHYATMRKPVSIKFAVNEEVQELESAVITNFSSQRDDKGTLNEYIHIKTENDIYKLRMDYLVSIDNVLANTFKEGFC